MIPLRDTVPSETVPVITRLLIAANVLVFLYQVGLGEAGESFIRAYGLVPRRVHADHLATLSPLVTSMFLHGGWMHLLGNMLYLNIFGDNVEDRLGHLRYLALYLVTGIVAGVAQITINPHSSLPMVGASGAIAGVTGAYFLFFPRARVVTLIPIFIFLQIVELPAVLFLFFWFAFQLLLGIGSLGTETAGGGVAFWAHIGGFLAGTVLGPILARPRTVRPAW
ncbi:MAG: rhomboid family intramembrane serine protease [Deltaproteobacteria bacterium]|nr:rhomboid family intramembrane serine protease [Deltaproteobacteria bacterium]